MKYIYPAIFTEEEDGILVDFPDLPSCYTDGATLDEAFENAEDALALALWQMAADERHAHRAQERDPPGLDGHART